MTWEYMLRTHYELKDGSDTLEQGLNRLGLNGWEVVAVAWDFIWLKRSISKKCKACFLSEQGVNVEAILLKIDAIKRLESAGPMLTTDEQTMITTALEISYAVGLDPDKPHSCGK